jgi:hypothetical protein
MGQKGGEHRVQLEGSSSRATAPRRRAGVLCSASDVREARETRPRWVGGGPERHHQRERAKQAAVGGCAGQELHQFEARGRSLQVSCRRRLVTRSDCLCACADTGKDGLETAVNRATWCLRHPPINSSPPLVTPSIKTPKPPILRTTTHTLHILCTRFPGARC